MITTQHHRNGRRGHLAALVVVALLVSGLRVATPSPTGPSWIVGLHAGATAADLDHGHVTAELDAFGMVIVRGTDLTTLSADPDVAFVAPDRTLAPSSTDRSGRADRSAADEVDAQLLWERGLTGAGSTVALVDTGVSEHPDLAGRIERGPNLAGDATDRDLYGHGTVMAGLIAGDGTSSDGRWVGVAPRATVLSVKVAGRDGAADVSQVLAGLHWLVACHEDNGGSASCATTHDSDVVVLAYATDSTQSATVDPVAYAIQRVHDAGMLVVASAGNDGDGRYGSVDGPGAAPFAYTVGAYDSDQQRQATFSEFGKTVDGLKKPQVLASGVDLVAPVDTDSTIAREAEHARRVGGYIRGSGTSQAAALAGGFAALVVQAHPSATPAQVRALLTRSAAPVNGTSTGRLDASFLPDHLVEADSPWLRGEGTGSLDGARGSVRVFARIDGETVLIDGEHTATGSTWDADTWSGSTWDGSTWDGSTWDGSTWDGSTWDGSTWDGSTWDGSTWDGSTWDGSTWDAQHWG